MPTTAWTNEYAAARAGYLVDAASRLPGGLEEAELAWTDSAIRTALMARRPDGAEEPIQGDHPVRYSGPPPAPTAGTALLAMTDRVRAVSPTAAALPDTDPFTKILAEFLLAAAPPTARWLRPGHDPEPGREVTRLFDGAFHYERVNHEGGRADVWRKIDPADTGNRYVETCAWSHFAGKIVADVTPPASGWFLPDRDPEPGPEVTRLFDGRLFYRRFDERTWREEPDQPGGTSGIRMFLSWQHFAGKIIADATQPRAGSFKINNPSPGAPVADWQTTTPGGVMLMLEETLHVLRDRIAAGTADGVIGTQWTPDKHCPILMVALGPRNPRFATRGEPGHQQ